MTRQKRKQIVLSKVMYEKLWKIKGELTFRKAITFIMRDTVTGSFDDVEVKDVRIGTGADRDVIAVDEVDSIQFANYVRAKWGTTPHKAINYIMAKLPTDYFSDKDKGSNAYKQNLIEDKLNKIEEIQKEIELLQKSVDKDNK